MPSSTYKNALNVGGGFTVSSGTVNFPDEVYNIDVPVAAVDLSKSFVLLHCDGNVGAAGATYSFPNATTLRLSQRANRFATVVWQIIRSM